MKKISSLPLIRSAWHTIYRNGTSPTAGEKTRKEVKEFARESDRHLKRVCRQLREKRFTFRGSYGWLKDKGEGKKRPIVVAQVEERIVQRAILDLLQSIASLRPYYLNPYSFGGVQERDVAKAIECTAHAIRDRKSQFFVRSDIVEFYRNVPRQSVLASIKAHVTDPYLFQLLDGATRTELTNLGALRTMGELFPTQFRGVAQGNCLSTLLGNILLHEFDRITNTDQTTTIRFIDDFVILGPTLQSVRAVLARADKVLRGHGLSLHELNGKNCKAKTGRVDKGFDFLGCKISPGVVIPSRESRRKVLKKVKSISDDAICDLRSISRSTLYHGNGLSEWLSRIRLTVRGWSMAFQFCDLSHPSLLQLDEDIGEAVNDLTVKALGLLGTANQQQRLKLLGIHRVQSTKHNPITWSKRQ
ncbi:MAG TPA: reverse transcriptase domain-containing protein [candidate division Zixibacteria bacterium]